MTGTNGVRLTKALTPAPRILPTGREAAMTEIFKNLIAAERVGGSNASRNINPSNTNDVVGEYTQGTVEDLNNAVAAAKAAFPAWSRSNPQERYEILKKASDEILARKDELGRLLSREEGKTLGEGIGVEITREPVGIVGMITPWNFPIAIPAWKIAPALAWGNCVVIKPADLVPGSAWALVDIIQRAGLPKGVLNLVMGRGSVVGQALLEHKDVHAISFTGSVSTGRKVAAACIASNPMKKVQLEMGGKNPLVVLDDADLTLAVET